MKITEKKREANRVNGRHSAGPKTPEGKARSSRNSIIHDLFSNTLRLSDEHKIQYAALRDDLVQFYAPCGALEAALVEKIAVLLWQQRSALSLFDQRIKEYGHEGLVSQLTRFATQAGLIDAEIPTGSSASGAAGKSSLECRELILRIVRSQGQSNSEAENRRANEQVKSETTGDVNQDRTEIEARIGPSMDTILRCYTTIERSLDRTVTQLLQLQQWRE